MIYNYTKYRLSIGIVLINEYKKTFLGKRIGCKSWQFPQGGILCGETYLEAMYRELYEETGLNKNDVQVLKYIKKWLRYNLPKRYVKYINNIPSMIGQKQRWYILKLIVSDNKINLNKHIFPEFDDWKWVKYENVDKKIIFFKKKIYKSIIKQIKMIVDN